MEQMAISNVYWKKIDCLSVCLTFFENADAWDLGIMTLLDCEGSSSFLMANSRLVKADFRSERTTF